MTVRRLSTKRPGSRTGLAPSLVRPIARGRRAAPADRSTPTYRKVFP